eukprot:TRINITY_DN986_c0_g2_i1.p2 TRINITY_DN986_c0_g2~~TRINITY_DN986_c0_g2_i1.p2  ORF type:complete len:320 (+),score=101.49 TRINITY_DN986_c0_g2_i1:54-1013(+)
MSRVAGVLASAFACAAARGAAPIPCGGEVPLWPGRVPGEVPGAYGPERWVKQNNETHVYNVTVPTIKRFCAAPSAGGPPSGAAVVVAPGGGYQILTIDKEGSDVAAMWNRAGADAYVLKYRVPARPAVAGLPKWWAPLQDAQRAVGLLRAQAAALGLSADKIGFNGFSAGGHLTGHISTAWGTRAYTPVDAADAASCRPSFGVLVYPWYLVDGNEAAGTALSQEVANVTAVTPPAFLAANQDDPAAPFQNSVQWALHLAAAGVKGNRLVINPDGGHGFGMCQQIGPGHECCSWPEQAQEWLRYRGVLLPKPATGAVLTP